MQKVRYTSYIKISPKILHLDCHGATGTLKVRDCFLLKISPKFRLRLQHHRKSETQVVLKYLQKFTLRLPRCHRNTESQGLLFVKNVSKFRLRLQQSHRKSETQVVLKYLQKSTLRLPRCHRNTESQGLLFVKNVSKIST